MKRSEELLDRSIAATLSAIEVYNKPDFKYREELFAILIINGWELLLKAKLLADGGEDLCTVAAMDKGIAKKSRTGADLTIGIEAAIGRLSLDTKVRDNIDFLLELRDAAIHFVNDMDVKYVVYALGAASLQNYQRLCKDWFGRSLAEYNFYILPLGFAYNFKTLSLIDVSAKSAEVAALLTAVDDAHTKHPSAAGDAFHLVCEVRTQLVSVKKLADDAGVTVGVASDPSRATTIAIRYQAPIDKYPLSYRDLEEKVKAAKPGTKQGTIQGILKKFGIRADSKFSTTNFRTKAHKDRYDKTGKLPKDIAIIYNDDAVKFIVSKLP